MQSVERALLILNLLRGGEMAIKEIALRLDVDKSTASRLVATLAAQDYARKDPVTARFRLGPQAAALGHAYLESFRLGRYVRPLLERANQASRETVLLALFESSEVIFIDKVDSTHHLRTEIKIGQRAPLHAGAAGKSILAFLPDLEVESLLGRRPLESFTPQTITDTNRLVEHLREIRREGFAISLGEIEEGVQGVAVPLKDWSGRPVGAITVTGPALRFDAERAVAVSVLLREIAGEWHLQYGIRREVAI